ncbi:MAG: hypothetical protein ACP5IM_02915 [Candidatus Bathyarchaeia archaeon]
MAAKLFSDLLGKQKKKKRKVSEEEGGKKFYCSVCGSGINEDEYENFDGYANDATKQK